LLGPALEVGDERTAATAARELGERRLGAHGWYRSTYTSISPPHGRPTSHASSSAMPKCSSRGSPPFKTSSASTTTAPSTQPPDTAPAISPCSLMAIFAPGGRGAERL